MRSRTAVRAASTSENTVILAVNVILRCVHILCVAVIPCKTSDQRKSDLWHSFIEPVSLSITNKRIT